eukprot:829005_1
MAPFARNQTCLKMIMFALFSLLWFVPSLSANVFIGSSLLPRAGSQFALGYSNDVIKLYGSFQTTKQFMSFNVSAQTFTDHGPLYLSTFINGGGQFYAQLANALYVINPNTNEAAQYIAYFDLTNDTFTPSSIPIPIKVNENSCIGAHPNFLAIVGGYDSGYLKTLHLYHLIQKQWTQPANLTYERAYHSCIVHNATSRLYVLGGQGYRPLNIETYHASNSSVFTPLTNNLLSPVTDARIVVYGDDIYVIGGRNPYTLSTDQWAIKIQIIDTVQQTVRYGPSLAYGTQFAPVVIVHNILYCFGGYTDYNDKWQYLDLTPTMNPTHSPTENPTAHPTVNPFVSVNPSMNPTENPSMNPFVNPTTRPSTNPSMNPAKVHAITTTTLQHNYSQEDAIKHDKELLATEYWILICIAAVLCIILCGIYVLHLRRKMNEVMAMSSQIPQPGANHVLVMDNNVKIQCVPLGHDQEEEFAVGSKESDKQLKEYGEESVSDAMQVEGVHVPNVTPSNGDGKEKNTSAATTGCDNTIHFVNAAEVDQRVVSDDEVTASGNTEK